MTEDYEALSRNQFNRYLYVALAWALLFFWHIIFSSAANNGYIFSFSGFVNHCYNHMIFNLKIPPALLINFLFPLVPTFVSLIFWRKKVMRQLPLAILTMLLIVLIVLRVWEVAQLWPCLSLGQKCPVNAKAIPQSSGLIMIWLFFVAPIIAAGTLFDLRGNSKAKQDH